MSNPSHVLCVVSKANEVFIHADKDGLTSLIETITSLRDDLEKGVCEHEHLMSEEWAGAQLSILTGTQEGALVNHVKICAWTEEWIVKNGFRRV